MLVVSVDRIPLAQLGVVALGIEVHVTGQLRPVSYKAGRLKFSLLNDPLR